MSSQVVKGTHIRNVGPMMSSARCGARTRSGGMCQAPAVQGKRRCRMHGGSKGVGAPTGNKNAIKSGLYTKKMKARRRELRELSQALRQFEEDHFE